MPHQSRRVPTLSLALTSALPSSNSARVMALVDNSVDTSLEIPSTLQWSGVPFVEVSDHLSQRHSGETCTSLHLPPHQEVASWDWHPSAASA